MSFKWLSIARFARAKRLFYTATPRSSIAYKMDFFVAKTNKSVEVSAKNTFSYSNYILCFMSIILQISL